MAAGRGAGTTLQAEDRVASSPRTRAMTIASIPPLSPAPSRSRRLPRSWSSTTATPAAAETPALRHSGTRPPVPGPIDRGSRWSVPIRVEADRGVWYNWKAGSDRSPSAGEGRRRSSRGRWRAAATIPTSPAWCVATWAPGVGCHEGIYTVVLARPAVCVNSSSNGRFIRVWGARTGRARPVNRARSVFVGNARQRAERSTCTGIVRR